MKVSTGLRSPRPAVQHTEWHRHFKITGDGFHEHQHAIGRREHEHTYARLGRVLLTWVDRPIEFVPTYVNEDDRLWPLVTAAVLLCGLIALLGVVAWR